MPVVNPVWYQDYPNDSPSSRFTNIVYDGNNKNVVLFGGYYGRTAKLSYNDTWIWNGNNWIQKFPSESPSSRAFYLITYDDNNKNVLLFGGVSYNDTWIWDGNNWIQKFPTNSPLNQSSPITMTYDYNNKNVVLLGDNNDTWTWDGNNWTQKFPTNSPDINITGTMSYDHINKNVVLFGGVTLLNSIPRVLNTTYIWDGNIWIQKFPVNFPTIRSYSSSTYDFYSQSVILFAGLNIIDSKDSIYYNDTWSWDGNNWTQIITSIFPSLRVSNITYDSNNNNIVLFGGVYGIDIFNNQTWIYTSNNTSNNISNNTSNIIIFKEMFKISEKCFYYKIYFL